MTADEFQQKKDSLKKSMQDFAARERSRLTLERDFLQNVLDNSLGKTVVRYQNTAIQSTLQELQQYMKVGS